MSFETKFIDIFQKYKTPVFKTDDFVKTWSSALMDWWQNQLNFAVWCATSGCGILAQDHLSAVEPLMRSMYQFHVYFQMWWILAEMSALLPQDKAWSPTSNPYDRQAYEWIANEFGVSPNANWHIQGNNGGLGTVYFFTGGCYMSAYGLIDGSVYDSSHMSFTKSTKGSRVHVDYVKQDQPNADEAWRQFILDKSHGFTHPGVERINDSIRTYFWAILGAQAQTRTGILGAGMAFDAQKQFIADVEDAISSPVDLQSVIKRYQDTLQYARTQANFVFGMGLYMAPGDMLLRIGKVAGYNNEITIATQGESLGLNLGINVSDATPDGASVISPLPDGASTDVPSPPDIPPHEKAATDDHSDEKTALIIGGVTVGLVVLWLAL